MTNLVQIENQRIANALRRMADRVEHSKHPYCWHMRTIAGEAVRVTAASLDDPAGVAFGAVRAAVVLGDGDFVERMKDHLDTET